MRRTTVLDIPRDIMILFLKSYFSEHPEYYYSEDPQKRKILIADQFALDVEDIEKLPSIIVQRGPVSFLKLGIGDSTTDVRNINNWMERDTVRACSLSLRLYVVAHDGLIAESIADECVSAIIAYKDVLRESGFYKIDVASIGVEQPQEIQGTTITRSSVTVDLEAIFMLQLSMIMDEKYKPKVTKIFLKSVEKWYETGDPIIYMEVSKDG